MLPTGRAGLASRISVLRSKLKSLPDSVKAEVSRTFWKMQSDTQITHSDSQEDEDTRESGTIKNEIHDQEDIHRSRRDQERPSGTLNMNMIGSQEKPHGDSQEDNVTRESGTKEDSRESKVKKKLSLDPMMGLRRVKINSGTISSRGRRMISKATSRDSKNKTVTLPGAANCQIRDIRSYFDNGKVENQDIDKSLRGKVNRVSAYISL